MLTASDVSAWSGFLGVWLLVAGPMFQGALELHEQDLDREAIERARKSVPMPAPLSMWWWLLPPVLYLLKRRRVLRYREATLVALTPEQRQKTLAFVNKATGWFMVAGGGALLASQETWQLAVRYRAPVWSFWVSVAVMLTLCMLNTAVRMNRVQENDQGLAGTMGERRG